MPADSTSLKSFGHVENRTLRRLIGYWFDKRGERPMPAVGDIDPIEIPWALGRIWLCDYLAESGRFRYRLAGENINAFWGRSIAGKHLDEIVPPDRLKSVTEKVRMVTELPAIVHDRVSLSLADEIAKNGERIILPLSDDGRTVNVLLGATHRDWFHDLEFDPFTTYSETTTVTAFESDIPIHADRDQSAHMVAGQTECFRTTFCSNNDPTM